MTPAIQGGYFITGLALGAGVGIFYGFLRPVQRKFPLLSDLLFAAVAFGCIFITASPCAAVICDWPT